MALNTFVGNFAVRSGTGSQSITGVGFQPKAVIFWTSSQTTGSFAADFLFTVGAADGTRQRSISLCQQNGTQSSNGAYDKSNCIRVRLSGSNLGTASFTSLDADGFTINWSLNSISSAVVFYMCLGGSDLNVRVDSNDGGGFNNGTHAFTGVGFKPTGLITACQLTTIGDNTDTQNSLFGIGFTDTSLHNNILCLAPDFTNNPANAPTIFQSSAFSIGNMGIAPTGGAFGTVSVISFDSDGFTASSPDVFHTLGTNDPFLYVAIGGNVSTACGTFTQKTSTGSQSVSNIISAPSAGFFASSNRVGNVNPAFPALIQLAFAGFDSSHVGAIWAGDDNNSQNPITAKIADSSNVLTMATPVSPASSSTTQAQATLTSLDSTGFTLNWGTADATAREIIYFLLGPANVGSGAVSFPLTVSGSGNISNPGSGALSNLFSVAGVGDVKVHVLNTQDLLEAITLERVNVRTTQDLLEAISLSRVPSRVTQDLLEPVTITRVPLRVTQDLMEVVVLSKPRVIVYRTPKWELHRFDTKTRPEEEF